MSKTRDTRRTLVANDNCSRSFSARIRSLRSFFPPSNGFYYIIYNIVFPQRFVIIRVQRHLPRYIRLYFIYIYFFFNSERSEECIMFLQRCFSLLCEHFFG